MKGRAAALAALLLITAFSRAHAQLPIRISLSGGAALPQSDERDNFGQGYHLNVAFKVLLVPLQAEASYDRMGTLSIWALGGALPFEITPAVFPIGVYLIGGAGLYNHGGGINPSSLGVNAGAGIRLKPLPILQPFVEGRGVMIFRSGNQITYLTVGGGIRF